METGQLNSLLSSSGLITASGSFNWANIIGGLIFSIIGFGAFRYGRKENSMKPMGIGIVLMAYPLFVSNTFFLYGIGIVLTGALFFWRD